MKKFFEKIKSVFTPKSTKSSVILLAVAVACVMLFSSFASIAQTDWGRTEIIDQYAAVDTLSGNMSVRLYKPKAASATNKVPLVVATHGYLNNKEMVDMTAVELSRRGYAVVAVDAQVMGAHGESEPSAEALAGGLVQIIEHFYTMPWVDTSRIGVTGHSMGGAATNNTISHYAQLERTAFNNLIPVLNAAPFNLGLTTYTKPLGNSATILADINAKMGVLGTDNKALAQAMVDEALKVNKVFAALDMANNPSFSAISTADVALIPINVNYGVLLGAYDEFFFKQVGAAKVTNDIAAQEKIIAGENAYAANYKWQTQYEWNVRDYLSSPDAGRFIMTLDKTFETYSRKVLPAKGEEGYTEYHAQLEKDMLEWNTSNPANTIKAPTGTLNVPKKAIVNGGAYTANGLKSEFTYDNKATEYFRAIYMQNEIHPWNHFSVDSSAASSTFFMTAFGEAFEGANSYAPMNQGWWVKEMFNFFALIAVILMIVPVVQLLMKVPMFAAMKKPTSEPVLTLKSVPDYLWYVIPTLLVSLFAGLSINFFTSELGSIFVPTLSGTWFPQNTTGQVANWAFWTGMVGIAVFTITYWLRSRSKGARFDMMGVKADANTVVKSLFLAVLAVSSVYIMLGFAEYFLAVDFRIWSFGIKQFAAYKIPTAVNYMFVFVFYYIVNAITANAGHSFKNVPSWVSTSLACVFNILGIAVMFAIQYITHFSTGALYFWGSNLTFIVLFPIIPILIFATILARKLYKETGSIWVPAFVNTILFTLITVSGTVGSSWFKLFNIF